MKSDQLLLSESRALVRLITNELNIPKCRELIEEFIEKYETCPSLVEVISSSDTKREADKKRLFILEKKACKEIERTYDQLIKKCKRKRIKVPQSIIDDYEQKTISSSGYTTSRFEAVRDLLFFLKDKQELSIIKRFIDFSPAGDMFQCSFAPSFILWHQERNTIKHSPGYCFDQIRYLQNNPFSLLFIDDYPLENENRYTIAQRLAAVMLATDPQITMGKYKRCVKIVHDYARSILFEKKAKPDSYDKRTGLLVRDGMDIPFKPAQLRGKVLSLLYPRGKERTTPIPFDEIYDKAIKSEADPYWDDLDDFKRKKIKKQIFEIYEGINDRVKETKKPFLIVKDLSLHFA